jgi:hypothetical protein
MNETSLAISQEIRKGHNLSCAADLLPALLVERL